MRMILLALAIPALCLAQGPQPRLHLEQPHYAFGKVPPDRVLAHRFKVTNAGNAPLTILSTAPSCGCTSTVLGKDKLAAGESTELEVTFNTAGQSGLTQKTVQVVSDDPVEPSQTLTFEALVQPTIIAPQEQVVFMDVQPKDRRGATVELASGTDAPLELSSVKLSTAPWLGVTTRELGSTVKVDLILSGRALPKDRLSGLDTVTLNVANPKPAVITLTVRWEKRAPVVVNPTQVAWAEPAGQDLHTSVVLEQREHKPFRILAARTSNPLVEVQGWSHKAAATQKLEVTLSGRTPPGNYHEMVVLTLDTPGHPELPIRVGAALR